MMRYRSCRDRQQAAPLDPVAQMRAPPGLFGRHLVASSDPVQTFCRSVVSILLPVRDHSSHSSPGVTNVSHVARDDMDMQMEYGLASSAADIEAHVEATRLEPLTDHNPRLFQQLPQREFLLGIRMKIVRDMSEWDQEHVPFADRVTVPTSVTKIVGEYDLLVRWLAKPTLFAWH